MPTTFKPHTQKKKKSWKRIWIFLVLLLLLLFRGRKNRSPRDLYFQPETKVEITKGDTIRKFYTELSSSETFRLKRYLKTHKDIPALQEGTYVVSWSYTSQEFINHLAKGPEKNFISYTVLEGRSIYDIDADLTAKGYISEGEYVSYTTNTEKIAELSTRYDFFDSSIKSLEGFLYPDTYYLDNRGNLVNQLVSIQLNTFKKKVRNLYTNNFTDIKTKYKLNTYQTITLASIIEKEEKADGNKPTVAGIFYNRLQKGMLLGADITLCYNFKKPYASCTPSVIGKNVSDTNNPYNTRQVAGLTPTPIGNPNVETIKATLFPKQTSYLFYLHDSNGGIHYGETNAEHERNKSQYL